MRLTVIARVVVLVAIAGVLLWLMQDDEEATADQQRPTAAVSAPQTPAGPTAPARTAPTPSSTPAASDRARVDVAVATARAFARPRADVPQQQWLSKLTPLIAARYFEDVRTTDAQSVPYTKVTGRPLIIETDAPATLLTLVKIATNAGDYALEVEDAGDGPQVTAIYPWRELR